MTETCKSCHDPLSLTLDPEESGDEGQTVPDDLLLPCGCHFHWQCLLDQSGTMVSSLTCPSCNSYLPSSPPTTEAGSASSSATTPSPQQPPQILSHYTNEGGVDPSLDIYPTLFEEAFFTSNPEARPARAFHTLTAEGDLQGMVELLTDTDIDGDSNSDGADNNGGPPPLSASQLLVWRDPLNGGRSALHVALEACQEEAVWLLLWLGSGAAREDFPEAVVRVAQEMGLPRREAALPVVEDVRFVRDDSGRTAADVCLELGEPWTRLVEGGLFS